MTRCGRYAGAYQFGQPLSIPTSKVVLHCYASHGVGKNATFNTAIRNPAINAARETQWVDAYYDAYDHFVCEPPQGDEWRRLGYVQADGALPWGSLDAVDPAMPQFDYLPGCHSGERRLGAQVNPMAGYKTSGNNS